MANMQMVFLGTSSAAPTAERGLSSIAIMREGELLLFDAGEGMQRNFIKAGLGMNRRPLRGFARAVADDGAPWPRAPA